MFSRYIIFFSFVVLMFWWVHAWLERGIRLRTHDDSPYWTNTIVGSGFLESAVIKDFQSLWITNLYESSTKYMLAENEYLPKLRNRHIRLHRAGIQPQYLMWSPDFVLSWAWRQEMLDTVEKIIKFNKWSKRSAQKFKWIHLDIEPHWLDERSFATSSRKRELLNALAASYEAVYVLTKFKKLPLYADLPVRFDNVWPNEIRQTEAERNQRFNRIFNSLSGVSLMAYERPSLSWIVDWTEREMTTFPWKVRIWLETNVWIWSTRPTYFDFTTMLLHIESYYTKSNITDIHYYKDRKLLQ